MEVDHIGEAEGTCFGFGLGFALGDVGAEDAIQTTLQLALRVTSKHLLQTAGASESGDE